MTRPDKPGGQAADPERPDQDPPEDGELHDGGAGPADHETEAG